MQGLETKESITEKGKTPEKLKQKSRDFLTAFTSNLSCDLENLGKYSKTSIKDDRSFTTIEAQLILIYTMFKFVLPTFPSQEGGPVDITDKSLDVGEVAFDNYDEVRQHGMAYIKQCIKSNNFIQGNIDFLRGVKDGEYIF